MRTLLATLLLCAIVSLAAAAEIKGNVPFVFDGNIFDIVTDRVRVRIRVCGIDIPESGAPGSIEAKQFLEELILNKEVRCIRAGDGSICDGRSRAKDRDRVVAQCFVGDDDIGLSMVKMRLACDWPYFSGGHYKKLVPDACVQEKVPPR